MTTTLRVEVTDTARITELLMRAGDGDGLSAGQLPAVDLDLLLRAVAPGARGPAAIAAPPAATTAAAPNEGADNLADPATDDASQPTPDASQTVAETHPPTVKKAAAARVPRQLRTGARTTRAKRATTRAADTDAPTRSPRAAKSATTRTKGTSVTAKPKRTSAKAGNGDSGEHGRTYRRSPEDITAVFEQVGTVAGVADHYNVPRHTAQSWVNTLRRRQAPTSA
jgi:hypothetical protein